jgi:CRISPR-associated protein Cas2
MADHQQGLYLIAYDIADPKRLARLHRFLKKQGLPLQYSVFTVVLKRKALLNLLKQIERFIHLKQDDVRCYRLPTNVKVSVLGRQYFPEDVLLFNQGVNLMLDFKA